MAKYFLPGIGGQIDESKIKDGKGSPRQISPLLNSYSPRLFGSPPQLTSLNDMRLLSSKDDKAGPVGDFYLQNILQDAQVANFVIGRAIFTGGMNNIINTIRMMYQYGQAISNFTISGKADRDNSSGNVADLAKKLADIEFYKIEEEKLEPEQLAQIAEYGKPGADGNEVEQTLTNATVYGNNRTMIEDFGSVGPIAAIMTPLLHSLSVQQPFYTFESDWYSYIQDVKMMINTAVIMLGLQEACVRIGNKYVPIGINKEHKKLNSGDVWNKYRFITPPEGEEMEITGFNKQTGDTNQYVSFMIEPTGAAESYTNSVGESQIFSTVINQNTSLGSEIAFITNSSVSKVDDAVLNIADGAITAAQSLVSNLGGVGRFTAAIAGSMSKSFLGDHTIYPSIFQNHQSTQSVNIRTKLKCSSGDPYSYLTEILVPLFHILGMVLPRLSKNNASAYTFPPLVQCHIPGMWGTRLGMVTSVNVTKNPSGNEASINGWPTSVDIDMTVTDLQHVLMTSPMNRISTFLNNHTMFDYIAQCAGVDKYRVNASMRLVTRLALAQSAIDDFPANLGNAILNDVTNWANRMAGTNLL